MDGSRPQILTEQGNPASFLRICEGFLGVRQNASRPAYRGGVPRVLVVDDDATVAEVVDRYLRNAGFDVDLAADGLSALRTAERTAPDLVVLDLMLPHLDGIEVCRRLRRQRPVPVIMLSARGEEADRILGLECGADDYVAKPFSPKELTLRVRSVLRRAAEPSPAGSGTLTTGRLVVDAAARTATRDGAPLGLTGREFDLLVHLLRHPARAFTRAELLEQVWGWTYGDPSTVTVHIRRLREKVEDEPQRPRLLKTVWGVGYRYDPPSTDGARPPDGPPSTDGSPVS
jgi:DNA-binding response OmpR family regulator